MVSEHSSNLEGPLKQSKRLSLLSGALKKLSRVPKDIWKTRWRWSGLGPYPDEQSAKKEVQHRGKTLWDWLQLIGVPVILLLATTIIENNNSRLNEDRLEDTALQTYFDKIEDLLLNKKLGQLGQFKEASAVARSRTRTVLRTVRGVRKGRVLQFLHEADLLRYVDPSLDPSVDSNLNPSVDLRNFDLSGAILIAGDLKDDFLANTNLTKADLSGTDLSRARLTNATLESANLTAAIFRFASMSAVNLSRANLSGAKLEGVDLTTGAVLTDANLSKADLTDANLTGANLTNAILAKANLTRADLTGANLTGVDLTDADLTDTKITEEQLRTVKSRQGIFTATPAPTPQP